MQICLKIKAFNQKLNFYNKIITLPEEIDKGLEMLGYGTNMEDFDFYDVEDIIEKFKYLCQPDVDVTTDINTRLFYFICYYLSRNGYVIKEFPRILNRPPSNPLDFTYNEIRNKASSLNMQKANGAIPFAARRTIVSSLTFEKDKYIEISGDINSLFEKISTRNANFESMSNDEKLKEIANLIEYMLLENGNYKQLDYEGIAFNYIDDDIIKEYRKQVQCFRHASSTALKDREQFLENQKDFMIDYGITIVKVIFKLVNTF